jgi:glycolate oxidase
MTEAKHHLLYRELAAIVGSKYVSDDDYVLFAYSRDTGPLPGKMQGVVVRPANIEEVVEIVRLANRTRTPVIPSGGRAGIYGVPPGLPGLGIVVDMKRLDNVLSIDEDNLCATAEAGISTAEFTTKLEEKGWSIHTAVMPWYSDTVGGQLSGVPGGGADLTVTQVGWNRHYILGMKVVLPTGSVLQTGAGGNVGKNVTWGSEFGGPDLTGMFIGDGGAFGIKVEATYRMFRPPKIKRGEAGIFNSFEDAFRFYRGVCQIEPVPCAVLDIFSPYSCRSQGLPEEWTVLFCVQGNTEEEIELKFKLLRENLERTGGKKSDDPATMDILQSIATGARKWREMGEFASAGRYVLLEVISSLGDAPKCFNTLRELITKRCEERGLITRRSESLLAAGSNSHISTFIIFYDEADPKYREGVLEIFKEFFEVAVSHGWMPDAHSGYACKTIAKYWTPAFFNFMRTIKKALDPNNIMNPGIWGDLL